MLSVRKTRPHHQPPGLLPLSVAQQIDKSFGFYFRDSGHRSKKTSAHYSTPETCAQERKFAKRNMVSRNLWDRGTGRFVIDPTAGDGAMFRDFIPDVLCFDSEPEHPGVLKMGLDELGPRIAAGDFGDTGVVVGNPPFSGRIAVEGYNLIAAPCVKLIIIIFPASFRGDPTDNYGNTLNPYYHLVDHEPLEGEEPFCRIGSSRVQIHAELQAWERRDYVRLSAEHSSVRFGEYGSSAPRGLVGTVWLGRQNPTSYGGDRPLLTLGGGEPDYRRKKDRKGPPPVRMIPMHFGDDVLDPEHLGLAVMARVWAEHPHHAEISLKAGNYVNAFKSLEREGALDRLIQKTRTATGRRGPKRRAR